MRWDVLVDDEKRELLRIARASIEQVFGGAEPELPGASGPLTQRHGVFVTLREQKELRGCIGFVEPRMALAKAVAEAAKKAAFEDPRFPPLSSRELPSIDIEISVLSPLEKVGEVGEIEVGRHGLVVEVGMRKGLLLPHVAVEYGWDRGQFLEHTAIKAGLPADGWRDPRAQLSRFTTETFSESELYQPHDHL